VRADPDHFLAHYNIGSCLAYLKRDSEAMNAYEQLIKMFGSTRWRGDDEKTRILHGCYMQMYCLCERANDFAKGEEFLLRSLDVRPDDVLSYLNLTICCLKANKLDEGLRWYDVLMSHPDRLAALSDLEPTDKNLLASVTQIKENHENT
jgi:tetratricopeptide (TPR) repeat protein